MTARQKRRARKNERKGPMVVCEACGRRQRDRNSGRPEPSGCERCGHIYGRYA